MNRGRGWGEEGGEVGGAELHQKRFPAAHEEKSKEQRRSKKVRGRKWKCVCVWEVKLGQI